MVRLIRFLQDMNRRVKRMSLLDLKLVQASSLIFGLILAKVFPELLQIGMVWLVIGLIVCLLRPVYVFFLQE